MTGLACLGVGDEPSTWAALGFILDGAMVRIGSTSVVCVGTSAGAGIVDWTVAAPNGDDVGFVDGLRAAARPTAVAASSEPADRVTADRDTVDRDTADYVIDHVTDHVTDHVNGVVAIDHVVVSTPDVDRTVAAFELGGFECRRRREGAAYGRHQMRQAFFWLGDPDGPITDKVILEVVGPETPDPARSGDPATFFGLALTVRDLEATADFFGDLMKPPVDAVQSGRRIATLSSRAGSSVAIAFMSTHV